LPSDGVEGSTTNVDSGFEIVGKIAMDVIQPQVYWIGKRCYRKNAIHSENETIDRQIDDDSWNPQGNCKIIDLLVIFALFSNFYLF
jgi:hypothetical protein